MMYSALQQCAFVRPTQLHTPSFAFIAQMVERILGKDEVTGSTPVEGSKRKEFQTGLFFYTGDPIALYHSSASLEGCSTPKRRPWRMKRAGPELRCTMVCFHQEINEPRRKSTTDIISIPSIMPESIGFPVIRIFR